MRGLIDLALCAVIVVGCLYFAAPDVVIELARDAGKVLGVL